VVYVNAAVQQDVESDHNTPAMAQFALECGASDRKRFGKTCSVGSTIRDDI
jgi:hypothetical protein